MRLGQLFTLLALSLSLALTGYSGSAEAAGKHRSKNRIKVVYKHNKHRTASADSYIVGKDGQLKLASSAALVLDGEDGHILFAKRADAISPIASITKLMTAMVVLDAKLPMDEKITIDSDDVDTLRNSSSRLAVGTTLTRAEMLHLALMSSENRAAAALARTYPGSTPAFVAAMNRKTVELGMLSTHFVDSTGLHVENVSTPEDLAKMVRAGTNYELIREYTTTASAEVDVPGRRRSLEFRNTNSLVRSKNWDIGLSKTGFIKEAGRCLVMQATIATRPLIIVLLDSSGKYSRIADAQRIKRWLEIHGGKVAAAAKPSRDT